MESQSHIKTSFKVKTNIFEGPLELLLELVERRKLLINDISLATVTDDYMRHVSEMQELSLPNTSNFISLAATLLLVKSKSLLPVLDLTDEEETSIEDLEERLRLYKIVRDAALPVQNMFGKNVLHSPKFTPPSEAVFLPDDRCTITGLHSSMLGILDALPKKESLAKAQVKVTISLEEMMQNLQERISKYSKVSFFELQKNEPERKVRIVGFLAILELFKQGNLIITQAQHFSDIEIELDQGQVPNYY